MNKTTTLSWSALQRAKKSLADTWRTSNRVDWIIAWLFASMLTIPVSGEAGFLLLALYSLPVLVTISMRASVRDIAWSQIATVALAIGSITLLKAFSFLWSIDQRATLTNTGTHIHFLFWLPITLLFLRANRPLDSMTTGVRIAAFGLFVWALWTLWRFGVRPSAWPARLEAGAQNSGVLGQLASVFALWLAWIWHRAPTRENLVWMLLAACPVLATGGRSHITVLTLGLVCMVALTWQSGRSQRWKLQALLISGALLIVVVALLLPRMEIAWQQAFSYTQAPQEAVTTSVGTRVGLYAVAWHAFPDSPWLGFGAGTSEAVVAHYSAFAGAFESTSHYHQQYLQIFMETGLIGFMLCLLALFWIAKWFWQHQSSDEKIWPFFCVLLYVTCAVGIFTGSLQQGLIHTMIVSSLAVLGAQSLKQPNRPGSKHEKQAG